MKKTFAPLLMGAALITAAPSVAQGLGHTFVMRGHVVAMEDTGPVICIGKNDGAQTGQVLDVYRVEYRHAHRAEQTSYKRVKVGEVKITEIIDDHFARTQVTDGKLKQHDIVELKRN